MRTFTRGLPGLLLMRFTGFLQENLKAGTAAGRFFLLTDVTYRRFIPFAAPSTGAFGGNSPKGRFRDEARCQRDRKSLLATLSKARSARKKRQRAAFSLVTFFWPPKRK